MDISISLNNKEKAEVYKHALKTVERQFLSFVLSNGHDPDTFSVSSLPDSYASEESPHHSFYVGLHRLINNMAFIRSKIEEFEK